MKKQFGIHIEVDFSNPVASIHIKETVCSAEQMYALRYQLSLAVNYCEAHNKEQKMKDHPVLFGDENAD